MVYVPMWQDEYVFYRITSQLPNTSVTTEWFYKDNPKTLIPSEGFPVDRQDLFHKIYDMPIYMHSPLANYIVYPIVKGANYLADKGIIPHIEDSNELHLQEPMTMILRIIPILLMCVSMFFIYKLLKLKIGNEAYLYSIPVFVSINLLGGMYNFYWDCFMWFFFILTLYLMERKSKWAYLTSCFMVNTKFVIGLALLIPLIIKNKKMVLPALSIIPFYIATVVITHDPFYIITHLFPQTSQYSWMYMFWTNNIIWHNGLLIFAVLTVPIFYYYKKYPEYVVLFVIVLLYAFGLGISLEKISSLLYVGALVFPLVMYELNIIPKIKSFTAQTMAE
jgi:hypothetical protein